MGNLLTFPMCGFDAEDWVLALLRTPSAPSLAELGPDHESWGMKDAGGGKLAAYATAGAFGGYLIRTRGIEKIKQFHITDKARQHRRLSRQTARPWREVFGASLDELETGWITTLRAQDEARDRSVRTVATLLQRDPGGACAEAQKLALSAR